MLSANLQSCRTYFEQKPTVCNSCEWVNTHKCLILCKQVWPCGGLQTCWLCLTDGLMGSKFWKDRIQSLCFFQLLAQSEHLLCHRECRPENQSVLSLHLSSTTAGCYYWKQGGSFSEPHSSVSSVADGNSHVYFCIDGGYHVLSIQCLYRLSPFFFLV